MQAVQSAYILAVRPGLPTEAWGISCELYGEFLFFYDHIAIHIRQRHLCGWDQVKVVQTYEIHLSLFIRKLACSKTRILIDKNRRLHVQVAGFGRVGQKEVDQRPL